MCGTRELPAPATPGFGRKHRVRLCCPSKKAGGGLYGEPPLRPGLHFIPGAGWHPDFHRPQSEKPNSRRRRNTVLSARRYFQREAADFSDPFSENRSREGKAFTVDKARVINSSIFFGNLEPIQELVLVTSTQL